MFDKEDFILDYAKLIYNMHIFYKNRKMYVKTEDDTYLLDLHLANESIYRFYSITRPMVLTETCLGRGFFKVAAHASYKAAQKIPTNQDWKKFLNDAYKYAVEKEARNKKEG